MLTFVLFTSTSANVVGPLGSILRQSEVRINDFTVKTLGQSHHISAQVEGSWKDLSTLEVLLSELSVEYQGDLKIWRDTTSQKTVGIPYQLDVTFLEDYSKTFSSLMQLFSGYEIHVNSVNFVSTPLFDGKQFIARTTFQILLPLSMNIQHLREEFYGLCESLNIDGSLDLYQGS